jgi:DNA-binding NarL/FixJ family response regulator
MPVTDSLTVLVVDDHVLFRRGLLAMLSQERGMRVVGEASDGLEGVRLARSLKPDVVLMDVEMPGVDGIAATGVIRRELDQTKVVILSMHQDERYVRDSIRMGASGYVLKEDSPEELVKAIRAVAGNEAFLSPPVAAKVLKEFCHVTSQRPNGSSSTSALTAREREILELVCRGQRNSEIAQLLSVSLSTVKAHLRSVFRKLHVRSRVQAATSLDHARQLPSNPGQGVPIVRPDEAAGQD